MALKGVFLRSNILAGAIPLVFGFETLDEKKHPTDTKNKTALELDDQNMRTTNIFNDTCLKSSTSK